MGYYYKNSSEPLIAQIQLSSENMEVQVATNTYPLHTEYDLWDNSKRASMYIDMEQFTTLGIRNNRGSGGRIWIQKTQLFLVWGGNFLTSNLLWEHDWGNEKILNGYAKAAVMVGQDHSGAENDMWWAGDCEFYVKVIWKDKNDKKTVSWFKPTIFAAGIEQTTPTLHVHRPTLTSINIGATKKEFYVNEEFSVDYGAIKAIYKYVVAGATFEEKVFSNFTSNPEIGTVLKNSNTNTPGIGFTKTVTISYGGKSNSYNINVHGVNEEVTFAALPQMPRYLPAGADIDEIAEEYLYGTITYDDETTSPDERASMSFSFPSSYVGKVPVKYSIRVPKLCKWKTVDGYQQVVIDRRLSYGDDSNGNQMVPVYTEKNIG